MNLKGTVGADMSRRSRQLGSAVVEFAFVFPILLFLIYGLVVYSYIFVLQESVTFVAQQAAASAVSVAPSSSTSTTNSQITTLAQTTVNQYLSWLSADQLARVSTVVTFCSTSGGVTCPTDGTNAVVVTVNFNMNVPSQLFPTLDFGPAGAFPPMPANLVSTSTVRI